MVDGAAGEGQGCERDQDGHVLKPPSLCPWIFDWEEGEYDERKQRRDNEVSNYIINSFPTLRI